MAAKYLQGREFLLYLSDDNWTTVYTMVCLTKQGLNRERSVNKVDTQCGQAKSYGTVDRVLDFEMVVNLTPTAVSGGAGEASYKKVSTWFEANTLLKMRRKTPTDGSELYQESECRVAKLGDTADVNGTMQASVTLELEGDLDETA